ncbi:MAG TPA: site-2 protease family protein [Planctomycetota bacterium]|nr:site-2 protease family protein [Planctomycetota bacterium]
MMRKNISLGRILGISIGLDYSWFLIFALLTWMLAATYYPAEFKGWQPQQYWLMGAATALLFFASVLLHELGHAVVAKAFNVPVRSITLFLFGGVAQLGAEPPSALAEFAIAVAGPLVSIALSVVFFAITIVAPNIPEVFGPAKYLSFINFMLVVFNMIPGYPLDGGRVLRALIWGAIKDMRRATIIAGNIGRGFGYLFIFLGVLSVMTGNLGGLWIAFIGWFLDNAATAEVHRAEFRGLLAGHKVSNAMNHCDEVPANLTLQQLVDDHILVHGHRTFLVRDGDETIGAVTLHEVKDVPREQWAAKTVRDAMVPLDKIRRISPEAGLWSALQRMERENVDEMLVITADRIAGLLSRDDVAKYLGMVQELA